MLSKIQKFALYLFCFSISFEEWQPLVGGGDLSVPKILGLIYLATLLPEIKQFVSVKGIKSYVLPVWLFFALLTVMGLINVNSVSDSFFNQSIFQCILLFWFLVNHARKDPLALEKGLLAFAIGPVVVAAFFAVGIGVEDQGGRVAIFGTNQNETGIKACISIMVLLATVVQNRLKLGKSRLLLLLALPLLVNLLLATGSRVAAISITLAVVIGVLLLKTRNFSVKIVTILLAVGGFIYALNSPYTELMSTRLTNSYESGDLAGRDVLWQRLVPLMSSNMFWGVGETGYQRHIVVIRFGQDSPHNVFIEVMCYVGAVGLAIFLFYLFMISKASYRAYRKRGVILPLMIMIPMLGVLLSGQLLTKKLGWLAFAYVVSACLFDAAGKNTQESLEDRAAPAGQPTGQNILAEVFSPRYR